MQPYDIIEFGEKVEGSEAIKIEISSSHEEITSLIQQLKNEVATNNFVKMKSLCLELIHCLPLPIHLLQDTFILRSRENFNGELFNNSSQLSYNPFTDAIEPGRFNLKKEPVFYGAVPITSDNASGQLTTICESCKELYDTTSNFSTKYFTVGKWNIIKPLKIVVLTFDSEAEKRSVHLKNINPHYLKFILSACSAEDFDKCLKFYSFFSEDAAKKYDSKANYLLTAAFLHALKEFYGTELGILYSSSMTDNTGLNLALSKELIDAGYLEFNGAAMFKVVRNKNNAHSYKINPCTNYALANEDGKFRFDFVL